MSTAATSAQQQGGKSGLRNLKPGEILFNDGEVADSLFIIQKGQIRLFKPKGKGFIEIGVLRSGEVIGEMAFFDEDGSGKKRSCSASALTGVEIIEISFAAFGKTMQSLNPWFKTIINTLATRLRKANTRIRELEDNSAGANYGGKHAGYEFVKPLEIMRILGLLFLVFKSHGEQEGGGLAVNRKILTLYTYDLYQVMEAKLEAILEILISLNLLEIKDDHEKLPNKLILKNLDMIRQVFIFYNTERHLPPEKHLKVRETSELLMTKMLEMESAATVIDIPNLRVSEDNKPKFVKYYVMTSVLEYFKNRNMPMNIDFLSDARPAGLFGEVASLNGAPVVEVDMDKFKKMFPVIKFLSSVRKCNIEKGGQG